jgi:transposase
VYAMANTAILKVTSSSMRTKHLTKMCSGCGQLHDMPLDQRMMSCDCGVTLGRDHNAAINILSFAVGSTVQAPGVFSSGAAVSAAA